MKELTREQLDEQLENIHFGSVEVRLKSMQCIRIHDAALRARLEAVEQERDELKQYDVRTIALSTGVSAPCLSGEAIGYSGRPLLCNGPLTADDIKIGKEIAARHGLLDKVAQP